MTDSGKITARFAIAFDADGNYVVTGRNAESDRRMREDARLLFEGNEPSAIEFGEILLDRPGQIVRAEVVPENLTGEV